MTNRTGIDQVTLKTWAAVSLYSRLSYRRCIHSQAIQMKNGLKEYLKVCDSRIEDIIHLVRGKLTTMARVTLGALVTIDVHGTACNEDRYIVNIELRIEFKS